MLEIERKRKLAALEQDLARLHKDEEGLAKRIEKCEEDIGFVKYADRYPLGQEAIINYEVANNPQKVLITGYMLNGVRGKLVDHPVGKSFGELGFKIYDQRSQTSVR